MRRTSLVLAGFSVLALALAPTLAQARAGFGGSFGSRGSRTWSAPPVTRTAPYQAAPMERSFTPRSAPDSRSGYGYGTPMYGRHSPFVSGLLGGLIGAGIGGLLFGHGFWGGHFGFGGFIGFLLQIFLLVLLVRWLFRLFRGSSPVFANGPGMFARDGSPGYGSLPMGGGSPPGGPPISIGPDDYAAFEQSLLAIQAAWTAHDVNALRGMTTPEMLSYFAEQLAEQESRGVRNAVSDVRLLQGDLAEAWTEGGRDYATVAMRFSMLDVTRDMTGRVVDGSPTEHQTAGELWTFMRAAGGGQWLLSAIQQAR